MGTDTFNIVVSTGHLGTVPSKTESFRLAMETKPDVIVADGGSSDPGPVYLGEDISLGLFAREELELFLTESRKQKIPFILGSAGDSGSNLGVDSYVKIIKELAVEHKIPKFKLGYFHSEVPKDFLNKKINDGDDIEGLDGFPSLTTVDIDQATRIVAVAGIHPYMKLLDMGADVIIGGRSGDIAFIAAPAIHAGFPESLAYHTGKMIECASFCAEPYMGKEAVIGTISHEDIKIKAYHPNQRCTVASVCGHSMYERATPFYEYAAGGMLDMSECQYTQFDDKTARIAGAKWIPSDEVRIKLEGAKKVGERYLCIAAVRDPHIVKHIDEVVQWCRDNVERLCGREGYDLYFHIFGKNGVLKDMEPVKETKSHELCVVIEGVSENGELAKKITDVAGRMMFLARIPGVKGTAGTAATTKMPLKTLPGYKWNVNHTVAVNDPMDLFSINMIEAGV
jgi:hypothetical protein